MTTDTGQGRVFNYLVAADYLNLSPRRFLAHVRNGEIPARIPPGVKLPAKGRVPHTILFLQADLDDFIGHLPILQPEEK